MIGDNPNRTNTLYFDPVNQVYLLKEKQKTSGLGGIICFLVALLTFVLRPLKTIYLSGNFFIWLILGTFIGLLAGIAVAKMAYKSKEKQFVKKPELTTSECIEFINQGKETMKTDLFLLVFLSLLVASVPILFYINRNVQIFLMIPMIFAVLYLVFDLADYRRRKQLFKKLENE